MKLSRMEIQEQVDKAQRFFYNFPIEISKTNKSVDDLAYYTTFIRDSLYDNYSKDVEPFATQIEAMLLKLKNVKGAIDDYVKFSTKLAERRTAPRRRGN